jgi:hypothetical protein
MYGEPDRKMVNPIKGAGLTTAHMQAGLVIGAFLLLVAIRRGFRGVNVGGVGVSVS